MIVRNKNKTENNQIKNPLKHTEIDMKSKEWNNFNSYLYQNKIVEQSTTTRDKKGK